MAVALLVFLFKLEGIPNFLEEILCRSKTLKELKIATSGYHKAHVMLDIKTPHSHFVSQEPEGALEKSNTLIFKFKSLSGVLFPLHHHKKVFVCIPI